MATKRAKRAKCDTPGCGRAIPPGGGGHPEICPVCLACLKLHSHDPVGPLNPVAIERCIAAADRVVLAWGKIDPRLGVAARFEAVDGQAQCLGKNGDGSPRHPLYLPNATPLEVWP